MPKKIDYPRAPLSRALDLASAVHSLGGQATVDTAAEKMNMKTSGTFYTLVSSAVKYGLIDSEGKDSQGRRRLSTTPLYRRYKHAYSDTERHDVLREAALGTTVFRGIYDRFIGEPLPYDYLDKLLIREYGVSEKEATRIRGYLVDALTMSGLLDDDHQVIGSTDQESEEPSETPDEVSDDEFSPRENGRERAGNTRPTRRPPTPTDQDHYEVHVVGPDLNTTVTVQDLEDFDMVDATIKRMKRRLEKRLQQAQERISADADSEASDDNIFT